MSTINLSNNSKQKLVAALISGCERTKQITSDNIELSTFYNNICGHIRTSACVPFMLQKNFGDSAKVKTNSNGSYEFVEIEIEGYVIRIAHEPSSYAEYREMDWGYLFPDIERENKNLTLKYKTGKNNSVTDIWLEGDGSILILPTELGYTVSSDEEFYEPVEERKPFEPIESNAEAR